MPTLPIADDAPHDAATERMPPADPQLTLSLRDLKRTVEAERQRARQLAEANGRLRLLDRLKSDFLAFISHELRTSAVGYERLSAFVVKGLQYFDWLATERIDDRSSELGDVVRNAVAESPGLAPPAGRCRMRLPATPCRVIGAATDLATVVRVLLDNAAKFSPAEEPVEVALDVNETTARLTVADRGRGFPPELSAELFRPFTIADPLHHASGSVNLALASAIVGAHGGFMIAASRGRGSGATFTVELPLVAPVSLEPRDGCRAA